MSASFDYSGLLSTAQNLISRFGRSVTLERASDAPADPARPWGPPATTGDDVISVDVTAVFLGTDRGSFGAVTLGSGGGGQTNVEAKTSRVLIAQDATITIEIGPEWQINDGTRLWEIVSVEPIKPGGTLIYFDAQVKL